MTLQEEQDANNIENKTSLLSIDKQQLQEEIYNKTVENKKKVDYFFIFFYEVCELIENEVADEEMENEDDKL